jgi:hypothetical protein
VLIVRLRDFVPISAGTFYPPQCQAEAPTGDDCRAERDRTKARAGRPHPALEIGSTRTRAPTPVPECNLSLTRLIVCRNFAPIQQGPKKTGSSLI